MAKTTMILLALLLSACATGYHPENARSLQDQMRNANPDSLNCPVGSVAACDIEGGGLVGKTYSNCRCIR